MLFTRLEREELLWPDRRRSMCRHCGAAIDLRQWLMRQALTLGLRRCIECIRLAGHGVPVLRIAAHLGWTIRPLANGGLDGLADRFRCGRPPRLDSRDLGVDSALR
jgi:hypothetical protein